MASTYTVNLGIEKIGTGEQSGTWGNTTNTNFDLIDQAVNGAVTVTLASAGTSGSPNTLAITDGASSDGRNKFIEFADGADLGATAYVQLTPNDAEKLVHMRNSLSGGRSVIVFQGTYNASNDFEIPNGKDVVLKFDGAGASATVTDVNADLYVTKLSFNNLKGTGATTVTNILDEDNMASDSATALATQQSIKAYVDSQVGTVDTLAEILANGNTTGGTDIAVGTGDDITFADNAKAIFGAGSDLQIYHDGSASFITDSGTGNLKIQGSQLQLQNAAGTLSYLAGVDGGATTIHYAGFAKLATTSSGIDVTGTVTADGLTVDGNGSFAGTFEISGASPKIFLSETDTTDVNTRIRSAAGNLQIQTVDNSDANPVNRFQIDHATGDVSFYEDTGTTAKFFWDASAESLGIGTTSPSRLLHINSDGVQIGALIESTSTFSARLALANANTTSTSKVGIGAIADDLVLYAGGLQAVTVDDSGNVGIGTASPTAELTIASTEPEIRLADTNDLNSEGHIRYNVGVLTLKADPNDAVLSSSMRFDVDGSEAMRIDDSGRVGIGTSSPATALDVTGTVTADGLTVTGTLANWSIDSQGVIQTFTRPSTSYIRASDAAGNLGIQTGGSINRALFASNGDISFYEDTGTTPKFFWDASAESLGIGTSSPADALHVNSGTSNEVARFESTDGTAYLSIMDNSTSNSLQGIGSAGNNLTFYSNNAERMRIDSSGNLLVGKTSLNGNTTGFQVEPAGAIAVTRSGSVTAYFNRQTSDGDIALFRKDGTTVGSIGTETSNSDLYIGNGDTAILFHDGNDAIFPHNASTNASRDAAIDIGYSAYRFKDLYLSGGVYLGGTAAANLLDDYEEGDYEATITTGTSGTVTLNGSFNRLSYTKIGRSVHISGFIAVSSVSSPLGFFKINLPFTPANLTDRAADSAACLVIQGVASANIADFTGSINEADANLYVQLGDSNTIQNDSAQQLQANTYITLSATYAAA